jgi:lipopolysaccharide export system protein LptA
MMNLNSSHFPSGGIRKIPRNGDSRISKTMKILNILAFAGLASGIVCAQEAPAEKPAPPAAKKQQGDLITVTSDGGAEIHQSKNLMIYIDNVKFFHPAQGLEMTCERLEVYRDPPPPPKPKPVLEEEAAGNAPPEEPDAEPQLREAIATGNVVIRKKGADGKLSTGKGQKAVFDAKREVITLSGKPQPELDIGSDYLFYSDTIILDQKGNHELKGPNTRTVFKKQKETKKEGGTGGGQGR